MRSDLSEYHLVPSLHSTDFEQLLILLLKLTTLSDCADPRDKVYGIVAYLRHIAHDFQGIDVDYGKSLSAVYESLTRSIIVGTKNLWALQFIKSAPNTQRGLSDDAELPSWVLDLRDPRLMANPGVVLLYSYFRERPCLFTTKLP